MTSSTLSSSSSSSSSSSFSSSFSVGSKSYDDYKKKPGKPPLPIPSDLRSKLPDTNTPWNVNPSLFKRLKEKPSSSSLYRKETLSSSDPEWAFVHHYFDHERPENRAIGAIHCIYNSTLSRQFEATIPGIEREAALSTYAPGWDKEEQASLRKKVIQRWQTLTAFFSPFSLTGSSRTDTFTRTKILPLWHGTKKEVCDSIAQTGFTFFGKHKFLQGKIDTTSTDVGYFGSGIYFTNSAKYAAEIYSNGHLILAWVTMREPFPVVADTPHPKKPKDMILLEGRGAYQNYNAHYIPVVSIDPTSKQCAVYYPCTDTQTPAWDELVIFQKTQALPRFWIELTVDLPKAPSAQSPSPPTLTIAAVLDKIADLLDKESVQQDTTLSQMLETRFEDLSKLDQTTPLSPDQHSFYNSISRLLDQAGKVRSFAVKQLLKPKEDHKMKGLSLLSPKASGSFPSFEPSLSGPEESISPKKIPEEEKEKGKLPSLASLSLSSPKATALPAMAFGKAAWATYFGDVGEEPPLPSDVTTILASPCPIWSGKKIQETHLLILVPAQVNGKKLTLESLGELVKSPKEGHKTQYRTWYPGGNENTSMKKNSWVLITRDVIPGSRNKSYDAHFALVAELAKKTKVAYAMPRLIEMVTSLFMHYVRSGERLYSDSPGTYTHCQEKYNGQHPMATGGFAASGVYVMPPSVYDSQDKGVGAVRKFCASSCGSPKKLPEEEKDKGTFLSLAPSSLPSPKASVVPVMAFGKAAWEKYFGDVGEEPHLPADIDKILAATCPIWSGKKVQETHLLILVPAQVNGETLTLQSLEELVREPKEGNATQYTYLSAGGHEKASVEKNTWVLLTRDVIPGSRNKSYDAQVALVAELAKKTKVAYAVPRLIEVATPLFMHYVRSGERLYSDSPGTHTRCQEKWNNTSRMVMGSFAASGVSVYGSVGDGETQGVGAVRIVS